MQTTLTIDNIARNASSGRTFEHRGPVSEAVVTTAAAATVDDARDAADSAQAAFAAWSLTGPTERRRILLAHQHFLARRTIGAGDRFKLHDFSTRRNTSV